MQANDNLTVKLASSLPEKVGDSVKKLDFINRSISSSRKELNQTRSLLKYTKTENLFFFFFNRPLLQITSTIFVVGQVKGKGNGQRVLSSHCGGHSHLGAHYKYQSIEFFIFILLSRERNGGAILRTNPDSLKSCLCFRLNYAFDFFNSLRARFHQAEIIIVKHLIQGRNNETRLVAEPFTFRSWSS